MLSTPNLAAWFNRILLALGVQPLFTEVSRKRVFGRPGRQVAGHLRVFTWRALRQFLGSQGLRILRVTGAGYDDLPRSVQRLDRVLARWPSLAADVVVVAEKDRGIADGAGAQEGG